MDRSKNVNIEFEKVKMRTCTTVVHDCTRQMHILRGEYQIQKKNHRLYAALIFTTACILVITVRQLLDVLPDELFMYYVYAGASLLVLVLVAGKLDKTSHQAMCILDAVVLLMGNLIPGYYEETLALSVTAPVLLVNWVITGIYYWFAGQQIRSLARELGVEG